MTEKPLKDVVNEEVFIDGSVDSKVIEKISLLASREAILNSLEDLEDSLVIEFKNQLLKSEAKILAIWGGNEKTVFSLILNQEWHVAVDTDALSKGLVKVIEVTPIDPNAGIE